MRFTDKGIEDAERDFTELDILPIHRKMIEELADVLLVYIDISRLALMGFAWRAIRKWQVDNQMTAVEITKKGTPQQKMRAVREMFDNVEQSLRRVLRSDSDKEILAKAIDDGYEYYLSNLQIS